MIVTLPIPSAKLSANARIHWRAKSRVTKSHRHNARMTAWQQLGGRVAMKGYKLIYYWPDKRRRDKDGAAYRCKAYLDGIADFLQQDDSEWEFYGVEFGEPDASNPRVEIHFKEVTL